MSDLKLRLEDLTPAQRALLLQRLAKREAVKTVVPADPADLSFAQERWLFQDQLSPADPAHVIPGALRLRGKLNRAALQQALQLIYDRHAPLRLNFANSTGNARAQQRPSRKLQLIDLDLAAADHLADPAGDASDISAHPAYVASVQTGFDLSQDQLIRVELGQLGPEDHLLIFAMHHIISDGWSLDLFLRELATGYQAFSTNHRPDLPELTAHYSDYVAWQKQRLSGPALDKSLSYWGDQLAQPPRPTNLSPDLPSCSHPPEAARDLTGATVETSLSGDLVAQLTALGQSMGCSLFTTLLTGYFLLLSRLTGQTDMVIGTPVSGRLREEYEPLMGLFLNTLALRAQIDPAMDSKTALGVVNRVVLEGLEHHELPFDRVVQAVAPARNAQDHPLFEMMFNFTPSPPRDFEMAGLRAEFLAPPNHSSAFSSELYITQWDGRLELRLAYQVARYARQRMQEFLQQYTVVLGQMVADSGRAVADFDLRGDVACSQGEGANPGKNLPDQVAVTRQIASWASQTPQAVAVEWEGGSLSYQAFADQMQAIAADLASSGAAPGETIAIFAPSGVVQVLAMAAVLEFGGVLMTLDPDLPADRRAVMLAQGRVARILHGGGLTPSQMDWLQGLDLPSLAVTKGGVEPEAPPFAADRFSPRNGPRDPAYLVFTSGSTGTPKAVLGTAGGLAHFLSWQRDRFAIGPGDRAAQFTGLSFDVLLRDVFAPLVSGATLVIPPAHIGPARVGALDWMDSAEITLVHSVPSILQSWLLTDRSGPHLSRLRLGFIAGEPFDAALLHRWQQRFGQGTRLINLYGPTETTLAKFAYELQPTAFEGGQPVGHALPQTQALILTAKGKPAATGEMGQIAISTPYRSLGYINDPDLTEARFVPCSHLAGPAGGEDAIVYLTGDLGWLDPAGLLHLAGRIDDQVKIRGMRVEPGEVAALLQQHPGVAASAVVARRSPAGEMELDAYYVALPDARADVRVSEGQMQAQLRSYLRARLPTALLPNGPMQLAELPLTPNHKLDRRRLPAIAAAQEGSAGQAPRTAVETQMLQIWEEVLGKSGFGVTDDFFDIGGHSLLALRLVLLIEQRMGVKIPLAELFKSATVAHLAQVAHSKTADDGLVPLWLRGEGPPLWLVHTGGGMLWNYQPLVQALAPEFPVYGFEARGLFDGAAPQDSIADMAALFIANMRRRQPEGPYRLAGHSFGGVVAWEMACQLQAAGVEVAGLCLFDSSLTRPDDAWHGRQPKTRVAARDLVAAVQVFARFTDSQMALDEATLARLSVTEQLEQAAELMASSIGSHQAARQMVEGLLRISNSHRAARLAYSPASHSAPVVLFQAAQSDLEKDDLSDQPWRDIASGAFETQIVPGDHVTMMAPPHVASLAKALQKVLEQQG
ncbi:non-ribosomal peptide synthetase [Pseudophaeobacter arcticus]|uniref:non-ribosomal peptide synthetase n=1 Tax=Pseudophaeobacter arcticus TaxID=385492 RepID=UPI00248FA17F|nr:non-ribosomal peptide synthetase [Pseudophaeobacter arcticus]